MDEESGEFMEKAELVCVGRSESKMERPAFNLTDIQAIGMSLGYS